MILEVLIASTVTKDEYAAGKRQEILYGPKIIVADSHQAATIIAGRELDSAVNLDRVEVIIRPFKPEY